MAAVPQSAAPFTGRTAWARNLAAPVRDFLARETGSAAVLLAATVAALAWSNLAARSYASFWSTEVAVRVGDAGIGQDLRGWVNNGLMTLFFLVVGLEARRELDLGELRERRRVALPVLAGLGGMVVPVVLYLAINGSQGTAHGWGTAMSTDTAFALGLLALVGRRCPQRLRVFLLTVVIADDLVALLVIATVYTERVSVPDLALAVVLFAALLALRSVGLRRATPYVVLGVATWIALYESGVDPVVVGLAMGLITYAYPAPRPELERAIWLVRSFREQPTPQLARSARLGLDAALSPNDRIQALLHPWTSYVIVPVFALANVGLTVDGELLRRAATSPVTLGILVGYVVGKPVGILGGSWLATRRALGGQRPPIAFSGLAAGGTAAGVGFTVSLLIAGLAFRGERLEEAKAGVLAAALCASAISWVAFRLLARLPEAVQARQLRGTAEPLVDLDVPVDPVRDHVRGSPDAPVTLVEYGDFECPYCGQAEGVVRGLLSEFGDDLRYVWRHLPLNDVHEHAQLAAEAAEAAGAQGAFWEMYDILLSHQDALTPADLVRYAGDLGLDLERFTDELRSHVHRPRVDEDVESADRSGVSGTPTFFVNGRRQYGAYDLDTLSVAVRAARARARATSAAA